MTQARYSKVISLNQEDNKKVEALTRKGIPFVDIVRAGIELCLEAETSHVCPSKELIAKVKALVKK